MTRNQRAAVRLRRIILIAGIFYSLAAIGWLLLFFFDIGAGLWGTPIFGFFFLALPWLEDSGESLGYSIMVTLFLGLVLLAQWAFLRPRRGWRARLNSEGRPMRSAVFACAFMAMLLTCGFIAIALELLDRWEPILEPDWGGRAALMAMPVLWGIWAWIFFIYWRQGDRYTQLGRMIRALVAGSFLEAFIAIPAHIWANRQQRNCYCEHGTYTALVFSGTVLLWAFGPGIMLLYAREKYRRGQLMPTCENCGYNLHGLPLSSGRCPECGREFDEFVRAALKREQANVSSSAERQ